MNNFFEELKKYFEDSSQEKILKDWAKYDTLENNVGPTVEDFLFNCEYYQLQSNFLSNQTELEKIELPIYFNENKLKINNLYKQLKAKKNTTELVDNCFNLISNSISELNFCDIHLEITKANLIKITTLYDDNKILIMSKEVSENDTDIIYSYFINKQLIASDVAEIKEFTEKFKEYLSL